MTTESLSGEVPSNADDGPSEPPVALRGEPRGGSVAASAAASAAASERSGAMPAVPAVAAVLTACDRLIGEAGRRHHLFSWLRPPDGGNDRWLEVDAYYATQRLIVMCRPRSSPNGEIYRELIPRHGLRLLEVDPAELGGELQIELRDRLAEVGPVADRPAVSSGSSRAPTAEPAKPGPGHSAGPSAARTVRAPAHPLPATPATGMLIALTLAIALCVEFYLGIAKALGRGHWLIAFGLALDLGARTIGTIVAARIGETGWAWGCVIIGSPAVAACSLPEDGAVRADPARLAGVLALLAMMFAVLGLVLG